MLKQEKNELKLTAYLNYFCFPAELLKAISVFYTGFKLVGEKIAANISYY